MITNLTVILGAGASVDLIPSHSMNSIRDNNFKPKVTKDLFNTPGIRVLEENYLLFPGVEQHLGRIRKISNSENSAKSLEVYLRKLREAPEEHDRRFFRHFALYLQSFFHLVSEGFCYTPVNYTHLLGETQKEKIRKVFYVTLNYDLFFDKALKGYRYDIKSKDIEKYIPSNEKWAYIKLHGSIDWGRPIRERWIRNAGLNLSSLLDNIDQLGDDLEKYLEDIEIDFTYHLPNGRRLLYPAISVPVDGESKYNCPPKHVEALKKHLDQCQNFLVIGYSGIDRDLLDLLSKKQGGFNKIQIVSGSRTEAMKAKKNFLSHRDLRGKLKNHISLYKGNGFSSFIQDGSLEKFIESL